MSLFVPIVDRPSTHLLVVRYRKQAAWLQAALCVWFALSWYMPAFAFPHLRDSWFGWLWVAAPVLIAAVFFVQLVDLLWRCRNGEEYVFDSATRTIARNGKTIAAFGDLEGVVFTSYFGAVRDGVQRESYTLRILLAGKSRIDLAAMTTEQPVKQLAREVASFLGVTLKREYKGLPERGEVKSLDLAQRQLDAEPDPPRTSVDSGN